MSEGPFVHVTIALGPALFAAVDPVAAVAELGAALAELAAPGEPEVTCARLAPEAPRADRGFAVTVDGRPLGAPADYFARAESVATGAPLTDDPPARVVERVAARPEHAASFVALLARAVARRSLRAASAGGPVEIRVEAAYLRALTTAPGAARGALAPVREALAAATGLELPPVRFVRAEELPAGAFAVRLGGLETLPWRGLPPEDPGALPHLARCLGLELLHDAAVLVDRAFVDRTLTRLRPSSPAICDAIDRRASRDALTAALRGLAAEGVSLRDLRGLLAGMAEGAVVVADESRLVVLDDRLVVPRLPGGDEACSPALLGALARLAQRRALTAAHAGGSLAVHQLAPALEQALAAAWPDGALDPVLGERVRRAARDAAGAEPLAVVTSGAARPVLQRLLREDLPAARVFSYQELPADLPLVPRGRIAVDPPGG
jgi:hypothetical protein